MIRIPSLLVVGLIRAYQVSLGRIVGGRCRFHPSCSDYAAASISENGLIMGGAAGLWRLLRCGPWSAGGIDPVRGRRRQGEAFGG